ncbi:intersectin-EH binding protein Ibp1 [Mycolicibacterium hodleri]|uniref:Intersectin-EH binding protein Ibp1 n=1 Tax=Mycolicibacterium hodleri TaxID=49897 RepID=A0A502E6C6_9MYCO|nr:intersectin-EH binding protein Ibp1 [Mycolicibacterium hodleri]TPG31980.1 intersectin-EH binding protein Ibp1 [Mycolicibacterium hodleri]
MPNFEFSARRFVVAGGFAFAVAVTPMVAAFTAPTIVSGTLADCASGEDTDQFTGSCVPFVVPNSPSPFTTPAGNPDIPEIDGIPCTGRDSGACIGLAEDAPQYVPPTSSVGSSPTVTGSTN